MHRQVRCDRPTSAIDTAAIENNLSERLDARLAEIELHLAAYYSSTIRPYHGDSLGKNQRCTLGVQRSLRRVLKLQQQLNEDWYCW